MSARRRRRARILVAAPLVLLLPGCGGGGSSSTPTTLATPPPLVRTVVESGSQSGLPINNLLPVPFTTASTGTIDLTVDWTIPSDGIHVYLAANTCSLDEINGGTCRFLLDSPPSSVKPRLLSTPGAAAGAYTLYIGNRGPEEESVSWQVGLTTGGTANTLGGSGSGGVAGPALGRSDPWIRLVSP